MCLRGNTDVVKTTQFLDYLVEGAESGGQQAAQLLRSSVMDYARKQITDIRHDIEVVVHVYANLNGLTKIYGDAHIIEHREQLDRFIRGFNMAHPLFNMIDAGNGKECSDSKLRGKLELAHHWCFVANHADSGGFKEIFKLHTRNVQCKHILFGGSADNGYARLLAPYSGDPVWRDRITLVEGRPFAQELFRMTSSFKTDSFPQVFRDTNIEPRRVSTQVFMQPAPPKTTASTSPAAPTTQIAPQATSYASTVSLSRTPEIVKPVSNVPKTKPIPEGFIGINAEGERVDIPLKPSRVIVDELKPRKMCNNYHLKGYCPNPKCTYEHGKQLDESHLQALKFIARGFPCVDGVWCEDEDCILGHRCPNNESCRYNGQNCRFPPNMHKIDTTIVNL